MSPTRAALLADVIASLSEHIEKELRPGNPMLRFWRGLLRDALAAHGDAGTVPTQYATCGQPVVIAGVGYSCDMPLGHPPTQSHRVRALLERRQPEDAGATAALSDEQIMAQACSCCECQGKKCIAPHPGHSHRTPEIVADFMARLKRASTPTQRLHNLVDSLGRCDRCEAETLDDPVVLCQSCAQPSPPRVLSREAVAAELTAAFMAGHYNWPTAEQPRLRERCDEHVRAAVLRLCPADATAQETER